MKRKQIIIALGLIGMTLSMFAQDIHFSQFYNSPLTLNPALTGKINGKFRVAANYRNQWYNVVNGHSPYVTYAGSFDMPIKFKSGDAIGVGLQVFKDDQGDGAYSNLTFMASFAYHKVLDRKSNHTLTVGIQGGYIQKQLGINNFVFADQVGGIDGTTLIYNESQEQLAQGSKGAGEMQVGLMYTGRFNNKSTFYIGGSAFNLLSHEASFLEGESFKIPRRYVGHAGLELVLSKRLAVIPSIIYMRQAKASELNVGTAFGFYFDDKRTTGLYLGGYVRPKDAAIAYMAIEFAGIKIGASYDFATSDVQDAANYNGSYEMSLIYTFNVIPLPSPGSLLYNPRF